MATTSKAIRDLIVTKLQAVKVGSNNAFGSVFDHVDANFLKYPVAVVRAVGGRGNVIDTHAIERVFSFIVDLYQEQSDPGKTTKEASDIMIETADAVLTAFDKDKDLSGSVQIIRVIEFDFSFKAAAGAFNYATFKVDAVVIVPNYS